MIRPTATYGFGFLALRPSICPRRFLGVDVVQEDGFEGRGERGKASLQPPSIAPLLPARED